MGGQVWKWEWQPSSLCLTIPFFLAVHLEMSGANFYPRMPIAWTESPSAKLKSGEADLILIVQLVSPCDKFYDPKIVPEFVSWCESQVELSYIQPLEALCKPAFAASATAAAEGVAKSRKKRGFFSSLLGAIPKVVGAVKSVFGLFSRRSDPTAALNNRINDLNNEISYIKTRVKQTEQRQELLESKVRELAAAIEALGERVHQTEVSVAELREWRRTVTESLPTSVTLTAELASKFALAKDHFAVVGREWRSGRLSLHLFDAFMMGTNRSAIELYDGAVPVACHMDTRNSMVTFQFLKNVTDLGVKVYRASPFTFHRLLPGEQSELGYKLEYVGPKEVAYDSMSNCLVPYSSDGTSDLILFPSATDCLPLNHSSIFKYWRKSCEPMYYIDHTNIQIRAVDDHWHIYCEGFDIHVYKQRTPCPPHVFAIHSNETFEIATGQRVAKRLKPLNFKAAETLYSDKIGYHLMPKLIDLNMDSFPLARDCPVGFLKGGDKISGNLYEARYEPGIGIAGGALIGVIVLLVIAMITIAIYVKRIAGGATRKRHGNYSDISMTTRTHRARGAAEGELGMLAIEGVAGGHAGPSYFK